MKNTFTVPKKIEGAKYDPKTRQYKIRIDQYGLYCYKQRIEQNTSFTDKNIVLIDKNTIAIHFKYDEYLIEKVKEIPGRKWNNKDKRWEVKASLPNIKETLKFARDHSFNVDKNIYAKKEELDQEVKKSKSINSDIVVEGLNLNLRPFQKAGVEYATQKKRTFIADEVGLGKTVQAIATVNELNAYPVLVICPAFLKINWKEEYKKWLEDDKKIKIINGTDNETLQEADIYIINYYIIKDNLKLLKKINFGALIADESHNLKGYKSIRTKAVKELTEDMNIPVRLLLSATPIKNKPKEYIPQLEILDRLDDLGGFWNFTGRYCDRQKTSFGLDINGSTNLEELNQRLREVGFIRRSKSQVLSELPPVNRSKVYMEIDNRASYEEAERDIFNWLKKHESLKKAMKAKGAEVMVRIAKLRKLSAEGKLSNAYKWIKEFLETGEKLILFGHHISITEKIADDFNCLKITGNTTDEEKDKAVKAFQNDENEQLIVISIQAGSEGITLTEASNVAFLEFGWTSTEHDQAEGRAYGRLNDVHGLNSYFLVGENTIDESILHLIEQKREIVDKATNGYSEEQEKEGMLNQSLNYLENKYN